MRTYPVELKNPRITSGGIGPDIIITHARIFKGVDGFELWGLVDDAETHLDTMRTIEEIILKHSKSISTKEQDGNTYTYYRKDGEIYQSKNGESLVWFCNQSVADVMLKA